MEHDPPTWVYRASGWLAMAIQFALAFALLFGSILASRVIGTHRWPAGSELGWDVLAVAVTAALALGFARWVERRRTRTTQ